MMEIFSFLFLSRLPALAASRYKFFVFQTHTQFITLLYRRNSISNYITICFVVSSFILAWSWILLLFLASIISIDLVATGSYRLRLLVLLRRDRSSWIDCILTLDLLGVQISTYRCHLHLLLCWRGLILNFLYDLLLILFFFFILIAILFLFF